MYDIVFCVQELEVFNLEEDKRLSDEEIMDMAIIYRKETNRPLSRYQRRMNDAAQQLCLQNPGLIRKRQLLIDTARERIIADGFQFVKGKSRSKKNFKDDEPIPVAKRSKLSQSFRENRIHEIEEDIRDLNDRIKFKDGRISAALNMKEYKKCDEIKEEVTTLKHKRRELEAELKRLQKSTRQSQYYYNKKAKQSSSTSDMESSEDSKKEKSSLFSRAATPESSVASSRSHTPSYSPIFHDDDTDFTQEVVDLTSGRRSDDDSF